MHLMVPCILAKNHLSDRHLVDANMMKRLSVQSTVKQLAEGATTFIKKTLSIAKQ
jgi:hypothetical protein